MTKINPPDYRSVEKSMWRENIKNVRQELDSGDELLFKRIDDRAFRTGHSRETIIEKINEDDMYAETFAKTPGRQYFHRDLDIEWLDKHLGVPVNFLDKNKGFVYCVSNDGQIECFPNNEKHKPSRPLDFHWIFCGYEFYAARVYSRQSGGSQSKGFDQMKLLLKNYFNARDPRIVLIAICNGDFYTDERMEILRELQRGIHPKSFAVHIEEVPNILEQYRI